MNLIDDLFKNYKLKDVSLLTNHGFKDIGNDTYILKESLDDNTYGVEIILILLKDNDYKINLNFYENNEEYFQTNFLLNNYNKVTLSDFNLKVLKIITTKLLELRDFAFIKVNFKKDLLNEIALHIKDIYGSSPEFLFEAYPSYAIFRNLNNKWFAVLMSVPFNKIDKINHKEDKKVINILNVKVNDKVNDLVSSYDYIFPGYHMSKKSWVSINLDSLNLDKTLIYLLISESYTNVEK